jgi:hypothetical protein
MSCLQNRRASWPQRDRSWPFKLSCTILTLSDAVPSSSHLLELLHRIETQWIALLGKVVELDDLEMLRTSDWKGSRTLLMLRRPRNLLRRSYVGWQQKAMVFELTLSLTVDEGLKRAGAIRRGQNKLC